jgi:hypothetical protein
MKENLANIFPLKSVVKGSIRAAGVIARFIERSHARERRTQLQAYDLFLIDTFVEELMFIQLSS